MNVHESPSEQVFETAAEHTTAVVPVAAPGDSIAEIRQGLWGKRFESAAAVAVIDDGRLLGLVRMEDLIAAPEHAMVVDVMDQDPPVVSPGIDQEKAAWRACRHGEATLSVVDEQGMFKGFIPPPRMLSVLLWEHDEDMARLGGFRHDAAAARLVAAAPVARRFMWRIPWLLLGLMGAMASAGLVGSFEEQLRSNLLIAFFVPGIVYMADAVGTQTETILIRGLSLGVPIRQVFARELVTGVLVGVTVAVAFYPLALLAWGDARVVLAAALALVAACSTATLVAMGLPYFFARLGKDPAFGSGPLATVIQDLLSILIYFAISSGIHA